MSLKFKPQEKGHCTVKDAETILKNLVEEKDTMLSKNIKCPSCDTKINLAEYDELKSSYSIEFLKESLKNIRYEIENSIKRRKVLYEECLNSAKETEDIRSSYNSENRLFEKYVSLNALSKMLKNKEENTAKIIDEINRLDDNLNDYNIVVSKYNTKKIEVRSEFKNIYLENLTRLGVKNISKNDLTAFKKLVLSGNQDPRSTLAFYFAFLQLKRKYNSDNFLFPLVIDSPFEGDPDKYNKQDIVDDILKFYSLDD